MSKELRALMSSSSFAAMHLADALHDGYGEHNHGNSHKHSSACGHGCGHNHHEFEEQNHDSEHSLKQNRDQTPDNKDGSIGG